MSDPMFGHGGHMPDGVIVVALYLWGAWMAYRAFDWLVGALGRYLRARRDRGLPPSTKI